MDTDADVLVVGAGPAGGSAAYFLKQFGYKVLIVDKQSLPRYKPCGGGVPLKALNNFSFNPQSVIEDHISTITFAYQQKHISIPVKSNALAMTMRDKLDSYIVEDSGADVVEKEKICSLGYAGKKIELSTESGRKLKANYVVAADGAYSRIAQLAGLRKNKHMGVALELEADVSPAVMHSYRSRMLIGTGSLPWGYYWIFPKSDHLSVGIGSFRNKAKGLLGLFKQTLNELEINFADNQIKAHPLPYYSGRQCLTKDKILLCGDAAGLVDPLTGEGIQHAITSGKLAAQAIATQRIDSYDRQIEENFSRNLNWAKVLAYVMYNYTPVSFHWLIRNKYFVADFFRIVAQKQQYKNILAKLPLYFALFWKRLPLEEK